MKRILLTETDIDAHAPAEVEARDKLEQGTVLTLRHVPKVGLPWRLELWTAAGECVGRILDTGGTTEAVARLVVARKQVEATVSAVHHFYTRTVVSVAIHLVEP
jgi:hypothetical protein